MSAAACAALAFAVAWSLTTLLVSGRWAVMMDHPNERSLHDVPTPRTGGLALCAGIAAGHLAGLSVGPLPAHAGVVGCASMLVLAISIADDFRHVPVSARLAVHLTAACVLVFSGPGTSRFEIAGLVPPLPEAAAAALTVVAVVWMVNLYNFMDGMDGFAGGMGVIGFATLAVLAARGGNPALALSGAVVAAACAGFLTRNFPPAQIFMGDTGSSVLGLLAATFALAGERSGAFPAWLVVLVFSPFVVDATATLARRALAGEAVWRAHRSHFYQRLVRLGWGHRRTTLVEYALMLASAVSAVALQRASPTTQAVSLCVWVGIYVLLAIAVARLERSSKRDESFRSS